MDEASVGVLAQLASQYRQTLVEIASLPSAEKVSKSDELRLRREARIEAAAADRLAETKAAAAAGKPKGKRRA